jgi:hypothetical protein
MLAFWLEEEKAASMTRSGAAEALKKEKGLMSWGSGPVGRMLRRPLTGHP